ncbi:gluconokinase [Deinococcus yavapaiensis]|uniref:gluconokinase n=1 Tax=Deinococcus yavapaiensis TaxID=309889 RepID=UPI000DA11470|nr:gluconokinase [Deinococcus yavapaiensis]
MIVVVMGVSGSGKTTVGRAVARRLNVTFLDADEFHSPRNVERMRRGEALTDEDRAPWLHALRARLDEADRMGESVVLACSALKHAYREQLHAPSVRFAFLRVPEALLRERLASRRGHFAGPSFLAGQLATLEEPSEQEAIVVRVEASDDPDALAERIVEALR